MGAPRGHETVISVWENCCNVYNEPDIKLHYAIILDFLLQKYWGLKGNHLDKDLVELKTWNVK